MEGIKEGLLLGVGFFAAEHLLFARGIGIEEEVRRAKARKLGAKREGGLFFICSLLVAVLSFALTRFLKTFTIHLYMAAIPLLYLLILGFLFLLLFSLFHHKLKGERSWEQVARVLFQGGMWALSWLVFVREYSLWQSLGLAICLSGGRLLSALFLDGASWVQSRPHGAKAFVGTPQLYLYLAVLSMAFAGLLK